MEFRCLIYSGSITITWTATHATGNITGYNVSIDGSQIANIPVNTTKSYVWDTSNYDRGGAYNISVYSYNANTGNKSYATNDNVTVYLYEGTPGVNIWQSGNFSITGTNNITQLTDKGKAKVLNTSTSEHIYYDNTLDGTSGHPFLTVNGSLANDNNWWDVSDKYYLY